MNCLLVMKIKWSLDINTGAVERSEAARARSLAGATVGGAVRGLGCPYSRKYRHPDAHIYVNMGTPGCPYLRGVYIFMTPGRFFGSVLSTTGLVLAHAELLLGTGATPLDALFQ